MLGEDASIRRCGLGASAASPQNELYGFLQRCTIGSIGLHRASGSESLGGKLIIRVVGSISTSQDFSTYG